MKGKKILKGRFLLFLISLIGILSIATGCQQNKSGPKELLDKYFSSAIRQDYATTYTYYYAAYKAKVTKEEYIKHRKEASALQSYKIISLSQPLIDTAEAEVQLIFAPSEKLGRKEPVTTTVKEDLVQEGGEWKIKVW